MKRNDLQHLHLDSLKSTDNSKAFTKSEGALESALEKPALSTAHFAAGFPPFLRGTESVGYLQKPWENRRFYRIDTRYLQDSESLENLLTDKPIDKMPLLLPLDEQLLYSVGLLLNVAKKRKLPLDSLSFIVEYELPAEAHPPSNFLLKQVKLLCDYANERLPHFKGILIRHHTNHLHSEELTDQVALSFGQGKLFLDHLMDGNSSIDRFASLISFHWPIGSAFWKEIAKVRAARMLWAKYINAYQPKSPDAMKLKLYAQVSGSSTKDKDLLLSSSTLQAMAGIFAGVEHLDTTASGLDKQEIRLIDRFLQTEPQITSPIDPWGGSRNLEEQTMNFADKINKKFKKLVRSTDKTSLKIPSENPFPMVMEKIENSVSLQEIQEFILEA